jgi:predicted nucleotidyltransferase
MIKAPKKPEDIFSEFTKDYQEIYGDDLISIILYGSGASGDYIQKRSDLNFLIILTEEGIRVLHRAFKLIAKWHSRRVATPLFMTREYIVTSLDVFPLEFMNIKRHYRLVWGEDPLAGTTIDREQLRLQCEREVKGKLLQLRETYLSSEGRKKDLEMIASQSITAFISIFQGILYLCNREIPDRRGNVIDQTSEVAGFNEGPFLQLLQIKEGKIRLSSNQMQALIERYIEEVRYLSSWVDTLKQ